MARLKNPAVKNHLALITARKQREKAIAHTAPEMLKALKASTDDLQEWLDWGISNDKIGNSEIERMKKRISHNLSIIKTAEGS